MTSTSNMTAWWIGYGGKVFGKKYEGSFIQSGVLNKCISMKVLFDDLVVVEQSILSGLGKCIR